MQPEVLVQLIQLGAMGLLGVVLYFVMQQQFKLMSMLADTLKALVAQNSDLQRTMLQALLDAKDESVVLAKSFGLALPGNGGVAIIPNKPI